jgi:thiamine pyrophosphokinase
MTDTTSYKAFYEQIDLKKYKSVLCLNGNLPEKSFFNKINLPIIAADGAANYLIENDISFEAIIGDLDSIDRKAFKRFKIVHEPNQSSSDFQKSLNYLKNNNLLPSIILGVNGGYIDHILYNLDIFLKSNSIFFAPPIVGYVIKHEESQIFNLPIDTKISLIGAPKANITTSDLKWDLKDETLSFFEVSSCFNRTASNQITIKVNSGVLLVLVYLQNIDDAGK